MSTSGYYDNLRSEIAPLLPKGDFLRVMDVGCGVGTTLQWLKRLRPSMTTIGVEISAETAARVVDGVDQLHVLDVNREMARLQSYSGKIDLLLLLDVLEHLINPWECLLELRKLLSSTGVVIASIPNVRNLKVLVPLALQGKWQYQSSGILDRTHLRFFTRTSIVDLFHGAGFAVQQLVATGPLRGVSARSIPGKVAYVGNLLLGGMLTDVIAHQYLIQAVPSRLSGSYGHAGRASLQLPKLAVDHEFIPGTQQAEGEAGAAFQTPAAQDIQSQECDRRAKW